MNHPPIVVAPIVTMLHPTERPRVDAAGAGLYETVHRETLLEVMRELRARQIGAVLVSVSRCDQAECGRLATVVREFPRIPAVALISEVEPTSAAKVLALGNCGVQSLVDVRSPGGWPQLRALLSSGAGAEGDRVTLRHLRLDLDGVSEDCWKFFEAVFASTVHTTTVRQLSARLGVLPSTLTSRFYRARLPAPKRYLAFARLIHAARLFENPGLSVANVANHLDYSSPQSFGRHVRTLMSITAGEFRRQYSGERMANYFREELVLPHRDKLRNFYPVAIQSGRQGCSRSARSHGKRSRGTTGARVTHPAASQ